MEKIIDAIPTEDIIKELTEERFVRKTNFGNNEIYIINAHNAPNTMREIGRLREWAFRESGGGTGKSIDIDEFDTMENPYRQLIVWDPDHEKILGGYRYIYGTGGGIRQGRPRAGRKGGVSSILRPYKHR